jgi:acyl-CoA synthetase (AMP-forming)/AMP-acid ligase II
MWLLRDLLRGSAAAYPEKVAFIDGARRRTWSEMHRRSGRLGAVLQRLGLGKGDATAVLAHDHVEVVEHWYACWRAGLVRAGINWRYSAREMMHIIRDSGARCVLVEARCVASLADHLEELRERGVHLIGFGGDHGLPLDYETLLANETGELIEPPLDERAIAAISYTTGTTGLPKGALIDHRSLREAVTHMVISTGLRHEDVWAAVLPFPGIPILLVTFSVLNGMTTVLPDGDFSAARFVSLLLEHGITSTLLVPTMLRRVLEQVLESGVRPTTLRLMVYGSMPCPPALIKSAYEMLNCEFQQYYGLTEGGGWFTCLREGDHRRAIDGNPELLLSCGRRMLHADLDIRDEQGVPVAPGEVGALWVRSETLMQGYLHREQDNHEALRDGWLVTHDFARLDEAGFLYLVDRKEFMIISGGYNVYPVVVENVLAEHPAVREAAVVGASHPEWGEAVVAAVSLLPGLSASPEDLIGFCRSRLGKWEVPKFLEIVEDLPRGATGKLQKKTVKDWYRDPARLPWPEAARPLEGKSSC